MILKQRDFAIALVPAIFVAALLVIANLVPARNFKPPKARMEVPKKKQVYGWPFVERWTEWETSNYPIFYGDGCTWEKPFVEPEWQRLGDDDDGTAYTYNRLVGILIVWCVWILSAAISAIRSKPTSARG